jgi:hypothetical protein
VGKSYRAAITFARKSVTQVIAASVRMDLKEVASVGNKFLA